MRTPFIGMMAVAGLIACASGARAQEPMAAGREVVGGFLAGVPGMGDSDVYDYNYGLQFEYRHWFTQALGAGAWFGMEQWEAGDGTRHWDRETEGDLRVIPLGLSGLLRVWSDVAWTVTVRAGVGYAWTDSDLRFTGVPGSAGIHVDDGWIAEIGFDVDYRLAERMTLFGGVMHRADVSRGRASFEGGPLQDNHLQGMNFTLGLKWEL